MEKPDLSLHSRVAIQLRLAEKLILERASGSGRAKRLHFQKQLEEGAPLPRYEESDIALLENADVDAKIPIILRKLEEVEAVEQELSLTEVLSQEEDLGRGDGEREVPLVNGNVKLINGTDVSPTVDASEDASPIVEANGDTSPLQEACKLASPTQEVSKSATSKLDISNTANSMQDGIPEQEVQMDHEKAVSHIKDVNSLSAQRTGDKPKENSK